MVYSQKKSSLLQHIEKNSINIVVVTESKVSWADLIKIPNFCQSYELIRKEEKGDGLYISTHSLLTDTCLIEKGNCEYELITIQIDCRNISWGFYIHMDIEKMSQNQSVKVSSKKLKLKSVIK